MSGWVKDVEGWSTHGKITVTGRVSCYIAKYNFIVAFEYSYACYINTILLLLLNTVLMHYFIYKNIGEAFPKM